MSPITFKQANRTLTRADNMIDEECGSLPVYTDGFQCVSCLKMSLKERLAALLFGKVWLCVISGQTQPPVWLSCEKTVFVKGEKEGNLNGRNNDRQM